MKVGKGKVGKEGMEEEGGEAEGTLRFHTDPFLPLTALTAS